MKWLAVVLIAAPMAFAAIDGTVTNGSTGKPQANSTVTLFQTTNQGPVNLGSVKTDAQGHFKIDKDVQPGQGGGPLLLQAVYAGVQYNKVITPGSPTTGVDIPVFDASKKQGAAKIDQHVIFLQPSANGSLDVNETYIFKNDGKATWNDPDDGTLKFFMPAAAQGKVEVNVLAPGGMPIRRAPDPGSKPNTYKLDFPIKPGESRVDLTWQVPFNTPGVFEDHILSKGGETRIVAPPGVTFKAPDLQLLGQEPQSQATIYSIKGPDIQVNVEGVGSFRDPNAPAQVSGDAAADGNGGSPGISENLPKLYALAAGNSGMLESMNAVKWVLASALGMLGLGFILLYRKGNPADAPESSQAHARTRG